MESSTLVCTNPSVHNGARHRYADHLKQGHFKTFQCFHISPQFSPPEGVISGQHLSSQNKSSKDSQKYDRSHSFALVVINKLLMAFSRACSTRLLGTFLAVRSSSSINVLCCIKQSTGGRRVISQCTPIAWWNWFRVGFG